MPMAFLLHVDIHKIGLKHILRLSRLMNIPNAPFDESLLRSQINSLQILFPHHPRINTREEAIDYIAHFEGLAQSLNRLCFLIEICNDQLGLRPKDLYTFIQGTISLEIDHIATLWSIPCRSWSTPEELGDDIKALVCAIYSLSSFELEHITQKRVPIFSQTDIGLTFNYPFFDVLLPYLLTDHSLLIERLWVYSVLKCEQEEFIGDELLDLLLAFLARQKELFSSIWVDVINRSDGSDRITDFGLIGRFFFDQNYRPLSKLIILSRHREAFVDIVLAKLIARYPKSKEKFREIYHTIIASNWKTAVQFTRITLLTYGNDISNELITSIKAITRGNTTEDPIFSKEFCKFDDLLAKLPQEEQLFFEWFYYEEIKTYLIAYLLFYQIK